MCLSEEVRAKVHLYIQVRLSDGDRQYVDPVYAANGKRRDCSAGASAIYYSYIMIPPKKDRGGLSQNSNAVGRGKGQDDMNTLKNLLPIFTALIGAVALLLGYVFQRNLEIDNELNKVRQGIYSRLITNITEKNTMVGRLEQSPQYLKAKQEKRTNMELQQLEQKMMLQDAEMVDNEGERTKLVASLYVYGTDEAIDAYVEYARANTKREGGDLGKLVLGLRKSIYSKSRIKEGGAMTSEADMAIWNDPKYLK